MPDPDENDELEGQDLAEVFDEENITTDGRDIATPDMERDVLDVTRADSDADDVLADDDDFDPDNADEAELEQIVSIDEDLDRPHLTSVRDEDLVSDEDLSTADLESESLDDDDPEEADEE